MNPNILLSYKSNSQNYINAVEACGGIADAKYLPEISAKGYDGLILCGGGDIDPSFYGEEVDGSSGIDRDRDLCEFALLKEFITAGKPILGICRGHQVINVYFGGSMIQDIQTGVKHTEGTVHTITSVQKDASFQENIASGLYGHEFPVNSYHHQAVKALGKDLRITHISTQDNIVEGLQHESLPIFSVQWHPEKICLSNTKEDTVDGIEIFKYFVALCRAEHQKLNKN